MMMMMMTGRDGIIAAVTSCSSSSSSGGGGGGGGGVHAATSDVENADDGDGEGRTVQHPVNSLACPVPVRQ